MQSADSILAETAAAPVRRSLLFVPGARPDRFGKALAAGADIVCIDLEDAVPPAGKADARRAVFEFLAERDGAGEPELGVRFNSLRGADGLRDVLACGEAATGADFAVPDFVMLPKTDHPMELVLARELLGDVVLFPVIESAAGLVRAGDIAAAPGVACLLFGAVDYSADVGCTLDWEALAWARSELANACAAAGVTMFDVPYLDVGDEAGLEAETRRSRALGIPARAAIHPAQIAAIHRAFAPTDEEIERARRVMDGFEEAEGGAVLVDGRLVDLPVIKAAERTLALAARDP